MRWIVFVLLVWGTLDNLAAFASIAAGKAGPFWPFAADSRPVVGFVGLPGQAGGVLTTFLAGGACSCFFAATLGLFRCTNWST